MSKILVLGDVMLDKYSYGTVQRLNPEGPNPLLSIESEEYRLGGSANVAANISSLHDGCDLLGLVGNDKHKDIFSRLCNNTNVKFHELVTKFPTITKQRFIENTYKQQLLRVDYEEYFSLSEDEIFSIIEIVKSNNYEYIVISDYDKGLISEKLIEELKKLQVIILVDSKPLNYRLFQGTFLIKPNFKEFCEMIGKKIENSDKEIEVYAKEFVNKMNTNLVITRGAMGASIFTKEGKYYHIETVAKDVFDVTGAGDTFIATIAYALSHNFSLVDAVKLGNKASGVVVGKTGTEIILKDELFN